MLRIVSVILVLSYTSAYLSQHFRSRNRRRSLAPEASILRASFSGTNAAVLLKPRTFVNDTHPVEKYVQYVGKVVPTRQPSLLVRMDENTTDMFTGQFMNADWVMWQGYWGSANNRTIDSKIAVFVDMVAWLKRYNITLRGDFNHIADWKAWHEASCIITDR
jgi:hypothetical protein